MYTQNQKSEAKANGRPQHSNSTAMTVIPKIAATDHHRMVAEAAYYASQRRGFAPGFELDDWLTAERESEKILPRKD